MQRPIAQMPPIDWDDAHLLLALLRAPSLAAGARSLGVDKSTASRRVESVEQALGVKLFVRTRTGLRATTAGERVRAHAERMESEMRALTNAAIADRNEISGRVRVATTEAMATRLVQGGLLDLRAKHPALELELLGGNRPLDLSRGEADLALRVRPTTDPDLTVKVLGKFPISLFASVAYLRGRGVPRSVGELAGHDVLLPSGELEALPEARWLAARPGVHVAFRASSVTALLEAAVRGHGLVPITRAWGEEVVGLEHVLALTAVPARPTWLVMHPDVARRPAVRFVADEIAAAFAGLSSGRQRARRRESSENRG